MSTAAAIASIEQLSDEEVVRRVRTLQAVYPFGNARCDRVTKNVMAKLSS